MFKINDTVIYGAQGVCRVADIVEKNIGGKTAQYYALKPSFQENTTIFVPVDNPKLVLKMHSVLTKEEIGRLIEAMPQSDTEWIEDEALRRKQYKEILSSGDRLKIALMIKSLYLEQQRRKQQGKKLHANDLQLFSRAESLLYNELALVLQITPEQVVPFLTNRIKLEELNKN